MQSPNISKFALQKIIWLNLISGIFEAERMNKSFFGVAIKNIYEGLYSSLRRASFKIHSHEWHGKRFE